MIGRIIGNIIRYVKVGSSKRDFNEVIEKMPSGYDRDDFESWLRTNIIPDGWFSGVADTVRNSADRFLFVEERLRKNGWTKYIQRSDEGIMYIKCKRGSEAFLMMVSGEDLVFEVLTKELEKALGF